ncbi:MAG: CpaF family protein [Gemmataceae bacterium]
MSADLLPLDDGPDPGPHDALTYRLYDRLSQQLDLAALRDLPEHSRADELRRVATRMVVAEEPALDPEARAAVVRHLLDELLGLGPLDRLMREPGGGDILVNGPREVWVERGGQLHPSDILFRDDDHLMRVLERIVSRVGRRLDESSPMVDARLPDGSRINAIIPPLSLKGPALSVRRFNATPLTVESLVEFKALTPEMVAVLRAAVGAKLNIIVSGGTGSGKTTLLNALSRYIDDRERVVTIEDAAELRLQQRHVLPLETRPANLDGKNEVTIRDLVRNALRMRPDRVIIGECRGPEALDMLQAMNTGHEGSMTTLHANTPRDALSRLETMLMMGGFDMPLKALRRQIVSAVNLIVQAERLAGGVRRVTSLTEVLGMEGDTVVTQDVHVFQQTGVDGAGRAVGQFVATGIRPKFAAQLKAAGHDLPTGLFTQRVMMRA